METEEEVKDKIAKILFDALHDDTKMNELTKKIWKELDKLKKG